MMRLCCWLPVYCAQSLSHVRLFAIPWTVAPRFLCSWGFSRQEYWSGWPCPLPGDLPNSGIEPVLLCLLYQQAGSLPLVPPGKPLLTRESEVTQLGLTLATPWTVAHQASLSMGFSRQEYWSGLPSPSPGDLPNPGIEPGSPGL